jgi:hypothetical protein
MFSKKYFGKTYFSGHYFGPLGIVIQIFIEIVKFTFFIAKKIMFIVER